jgi:hypothetical protein
MAGIAQTNLIKLCVGCSSIAELQEWIEETQLLHKRLRRPYEQTHTTRMMPKRIGAGKTEASLYWVMKSQIICRQRLLEIRPFIDGEGIGRCQLILEPVVHPVRPRPMKPFQGWRYLDQTDAPPDLTSLGANDDMPDDLRRELAGLGLL